MTRCEAEVGKPGAWRHVGYDNADGRALAKGEAMVAALKANGMRAMTEAYED